MKSAMAPKYKICSTYGGNERNFAQHAKGQTKNHQRQLGHLKRPFANASLDSIRLAPMYLHIHFDTKGALNANAEKVNATRRV
jgi:hypothetical protein